MLAIWNEFTRFVSDAAPAFAVGLMLSAGVQWLVARSHWRRERFLGWRSLFQVLLWQARLYLGAR